MATAAGLVLLGVRLRALILLAVGSVAALSVVPRVLMAHFPDTLAAPLALLATGILLVVAALLTASRVSRRGGPKPAPTAVPGTGWPSIAAFAVAVAGTVVVLSLA